jgi:hypothetical protein
VHTYASVDDRDQQLWNPRLLSLFHYFDCQQALQRCEDVLLVDYHDEGPTLQTWTWLRKAVKYGLKRVETFCLHEIGRDDRVRLDDADYSAVLKQLTFDTLLKVVEAYSKSRPPKWGGMRGTTRPYTRV